MVLHRRLEYGIDGFYAGGPKRVQCARPRRRVEPELIGQGKHKSERQHPFGNRSQEAGRLPAHTRADITYTC